MKMICNILNKIVKLAVLCQNHAEVIHDVNLFPLHQSSSS